MTLYSHKAYEQAFEEIKYTLRKQECLQNKKQGFLWTRQQLLTFESLHGVMCELLTTLQEEFGVKKVTLHNSSLIERVNWQKRLISKLIQQY
jgi:hypothetical protein